VNSEDSTSVSDWKKVRQSELEFQIGFNHELKVWLREVGWRPRRAVSDQDETKA
jgi:hypothetical protein